jgi:protein SCO1
VSYIFRFYMACWRSTVSAVSVAAVLALAGCGTKLPSLGAVPDFALTDQTAATFNSASALRGHVWVADFMFTTCPGPCPRMSSQMHQVQTAFAGEPVKLVSLTVDPAHDAPEVLAKYAEFYKATPGVWYFLTGPQETLNHLDQDVFKLGSVDGSLLHSTRFILIDRQSQVRGYYLTSDDDAITRLIADVKTLLKERS